MNVVLDTSKDFSNFDVKSFEVKPLSHAEVNEFICNWHYSKSINGVNISHAFGLLSGDNLIGAMIFGNLAMHNAWQKYVSDPSEIIELRRLCCVDKTPRNTESYFIGKCLKWMKKNTSYKVVVSYADAFHNHSGIIYRASNFKYMGVTAKGKLIQYNGKTYHDKTIRTYYVNKSGEKNLKPFAQKIKDALLSGDANYIDTPGKHIYIYQL